jgi:hypothetical protein
MTEAAKGAIFSVSSTEAAAKTITGITAANPPVVTAAAHGYVNGSIVRISSVVGMTQVNDRAFVVANQTTNTFELKGINGTGYTPYGSGGQAFGQTMVAVAKCSKIGPGFNGQAPKIDITHLRSTGTETLLGIPDFGEMPLGMWDETDTGQTRLQALHESGSTVAFSITLQTTGRVAAFLGQVMQYSFDELSAATAFSSQAQINVTNYPSRFA